jgi:hypothetical protein
MVSRELLGQLEALTRAEGRAEPQRSRRSHQLEPHEHVNCSVDGHDVRLTVAEPRMDLRDRQRHSSICQDLEDGAPWAGQPKTAPREEVRQSLSGGK